MSLFLASTFNFYMFERAQQSNESHLKVLKDLNILLGKGKPLMEVIHCVQLGSVYTLETGYLHFKSRGNKEMCTGNSAWFVYLL